MLDRLDDLRARLQGRGVTPGPARRDPGDRDDADPDDVDPAAARRVGVDAYGPCPSCGGAREIVMNPVGKDAARMGLICAGCGATTGI